MTIHMVWTRSGTRRHGARLGSIYTLCGREHTGFFSPFSGRISPRFAAHISRQEGTCRICAKEAERERNHKQQQIG